MIVQRSLISFLLSSGIYTSVDYPNATVTTSAGINDAGKIVGMYVDNSRNQHGFLLSSGTYSITDYPGANSTTNTAINNAGQIVGMYIDSSLNQHGFLLNTITVQTPPEFSLALGGIIAMSAVGGIVLYKRFV